MTAASGKIVLMIGLAWLSVRGLSQSVYLESPDKQVQATLTAGTASRSLVSYSLNSKGIAAVQNAVIGFDCFRLFAGSVRLSGIRRNRVVSEWNTLYGERSSVPENYHELLFDFHSDSDTGVKITVACRAYNEGFAFQYTIFSHGDSIHLADELSSFGLPPGVSAWATPHAQGLIKQQKISDIKGAVERPLTVKAGPQMFIALGEAALVDFARMKFIVKKNNVLATKLDGAVMMKDSLVSPWRYVITGSNPGDLLEKNYLLLNLNKPCQLENTSWIKPGKVIRESTLTTDGAVRCIDFAAKHGISYICFDAGWYGKEDSDTSDATQVSIDPARYQGPLDLQKVIRYGEKNKIGVILYVNRRALERQLDTLLPLYRSWGVKGLKFGFVQTGSQRWTSWLHEAIRKCADYQMLVDVHDDYRPTGYSRTYPNLLTMEGIRGDEESPYTGQTIATIFTRMIAGPADNTICYFTGRVDKMGSHGAQLAKALCLYSPLQFLYWYDRPVADTVTSFSEGEMRPVPELSWFDSLPTVWDQSTVLESHMENFATIARRKENTWWVGSLNGVQARTMRLPLAFLAGGKQYTATIYEDEAATPTSTHVKITSKKVDSKTVLRFRLGPRQGLAIRIDPERTETVSLFEVKPDHDDWVYAAGEPVYFTVSSAQRKNGKLRIHYEIGEEKIPAMRSGDTVIGETPIRLKATLDKPGFLRCIITADIDGKKNRSLATAACMPGGIRPTVSMPADFDDFWRDAIGDMRKVPVNSQLRLLPERSTDKVNVYEVSLQGVSKGAHMYGILCVPTSPGKHPAVLEVPGAGVRPYPGDITLAEKGLITFQIGIHGVPVTLPQQVYYDLAFGALKDYYFFNLDNRDAYYYKRVYLGCVRSMDFLSSLPEADTSAMAVYGGSQGGALSIVTAALDNRVKYLACLYPALCDLTGYLHGRAGGWPHVFAPSMDSSYKTPQKIHTAAYYDIVNFASMLRVPGFYSWGFNDEVCPPTSIYAAYNTIRSPKELFIMKESGHWSTPEQSAKANAWLIKNLAGDRQ